MFSDGPGCCIVMQASDLLKLLQNAGCPPCSTQCCFKLSKLLLRCRHGNTMSVALLSDVCVGLQYERTNRVYNYLNNNCGITHITVGDGGNSEQLQTVYVDDNSTTACPAPVASRCPTFQAADAGGAQNGFCPPRQPAWSAFREAAFGHGMFFHIPGSCTSCRLLYSIHGTVVHC